MKSHAVRNLGILVFILVYARFAYNYGIRYIGNEYVDLPSFYLAADMAFNGGQSPYGIAAFTPIDPTVNPYLYPPTSLPFLFPLSRMSYQVVKWLFLAGNHLLVLLAAWLMLFKLLPPQESQESRGILLIFGIVYIFLYYPIVSTIENGQVDLFVLVMLLLAWWAHNEDAHPALVAIPLAVAISIKLYPGLLLGLFLVKRRFDIIAWCVGTVALIAAVTLVVLPVHLWADWITKVLPNGGYGRLIVGGLWPGIPGNQSINGFTSRLFVASPFTQPLIPSTTAAHLVPYMLALAVFAVTVYTVLLTTRKQGSTLFDLEFSLVLLCIYLIAPVSWISHLAYLIPVVLIAINSFLVKRQAPYLDLIIALGAAVVALPIPTSVFGQQGIATLGLSIRFFAVAGLWAAMALAASMIAPGRLEVTAGTANSK